MNRSPQRPGSTQHTGGQGSPTVSALMIPMLFLGILIGFFAGYFLVWWGLLIVGAVLLLAVSMVLSGKDRDAATGAMVGVVLGYAGLILLALFRGGVL